MPTIKVVQATILRHWDHASQTKWYEPRVFFYGSTEANRKISCDADVTSIDDFVKSAVCETQMVALTLAWVQSASFTRQENANTTYVFVPKDVDREVSAIALGDWNGVATYALLAHNCELSLPVSGNLRSTGHLPLDSLSEYQLNEDEGFAQFLQSRLQHLHVTKPE